jgi:hypothetical protein
LVYNSGTIGVFDMKKHMTIIALSQQQKKELDNFIDFINELIEKLQQSRGALTALVHNTKYCIKLRRQRKSFYKNIDSTKKLFPKLSEKNQVAIELQYYKAIQELNRLIPKAENEIKNDYGFFIRAFLLRELKKTVAIVLAAQLEMSKQLYQDNSQEILSNPKLYNELVATWADLENN